MWYYPSSSRYLVITSGSAPIPGHLPRNALLEECFFRDIVRIEDPANNEWEKVKALEKDYALQQKSSSELGVFIFVFAATIGTMLFPPIGIAMMIYAFSRKKR